MEENLRICCSRQSLLCCVACLLYMEILLIGEAAAFALRDSGRAATAILPHSSLTTQPPPNPVNSSTSCSGPKSTYTMTVEYESEQSDQGTSVSDFNDGDLIGGNGSRSEKDQSDFYVFAHNCTGHVPSFFANVGTIRFITPQLDRLPASLRCEWKISVESNLYLSVNFLDFQLFGPCTFSNMVIREGSHRSSSKVAELCSDSEPRPVHSKHNVMYFQLYVEKLARFPEITLRFQASEEPNFPTMHVHFDTNTSGYITSPGYDGVSFHQTFLDHSYTLRVPLQHVVMLSFSRFHLESSDGCVDDYLSLYAVYDATNASLVWRKCGTAVIHTAVFYTSLLFHLHVETSRRVGFKALFSFHHSHLAPRQLDSGQFDCTSPSYNLFRQHLACNLVPECDSGKDEQGCPHDTEACDGQLQLGTKCYRFVSWTREASWNQASRECQRTGATLVTLKTSREWSAVTRIINMSKRSEPIYVGLRTSAPTLPVLYRHAWQWIDHTIAYNASLDHIATAVQACAALFASHQDFFMAVDCDSERKSHAICQWEGPSRDNSTSGQRQGMAAGRTAARPPLWDTWFSMGGMRRCKRGHVVRDFLSRDPHADCEPVDEAPFYTPTYRCRSEGLVSHSLVCDDLPDCLDGSDEDFCVHDPCLEAACSSGQCMAWNQWCDGRQRCRDASDERHCASGSRSRMVRRPPPAVLTFDGFGDFSLEDRACPDTHLQCPGDGYCLPIFLRCNGVYDCPGWEDELGCANVTCPGLFRCRGAPVCLHPDHVCDGVMHCPHHDDELLCDLGCPDGCRCLGAEFVCPLAFHPDQFPYLRYLDASQSRIPLTRLSSNSLLISLRLSQCDLVEVAGLNLPNLRTLDVSDNKLVNIKMENICPLQNLQQLRVSHNPLISVTKSDSNCSLESMESIEMTHTDMMFFNGSFLYVFPYLKTLNVSHNSLSTVTHEGLGGVKKLEVFDARHSPIHTFPTGLFEDLSNLATVYVDNYRLCCSEILPQHVGARCFAPTDELSSCKELLRSNTYRIFLWGFSVLALVGNGGSLIFRLFWQKNPAVCGFNIFVINLCLADFIMGVYLAMIGSADALFKGEYLRQEMAWKSSVFCKAAGVLSFLSSEVSALVICLITLDRFVSLRFPFSQLRFRPQSAWAACVAVWLVGGVIAFIPLLPFTWHWDFFGQTSICIPLPITRIQFPGWRYAFGVMIVFNFALFLLIAAGQTVIYWSIRAMSLNPDSSNIKSRDIVIARRLAAVVLSDFCCWFPIGILGLLASQGVPVPSEVNVAIAIFVMPLNSALNPFLYTLNTVLEKSKRAREEQILKLLKLRALFRTHSTRTSAT